MANSIVWRNFQQNFQYNQEERFVSHSNLKEQMWVPKPDRCRLCLCKMRTANISKVFPYVTFIEDIVSKFPLEL